ncbi:uncharacterized protein Dsimw501_GD23170 [Drosophila simulans]|uniref:Gustatory receptor n=1 Tax=Drosophila simulans TaxID=7240 RepID=A0A0J9QUK0_DROSI|nr:uncharacterized protein Dsimw501_GD23170 [Drosophila simulans]
MCLKAALVCMEVPFIFVCFGLTYYFLKGDSENLAENGIYYCVHMVSQVAMSTISTFWLLLLCHSSSYSSMFVSVGNRVLQMDRVVRRSFADKHIRYDESLVVSFVIKVLLTMHHIVAQYTPHDKVIVNVRFPTVNVIIFELYYCCYFLYQLLLLSWLQAISTFLNSYIENVKDRGQLSTKLSRKLITVFDIYKEMGTIHFRMTNAWLRASSMLFISIYYTAHESTYTFYCLFALSETPMIDRVYVLIFKKLGTCLHPLLAVLLMGTANDRLRQLETQLSQNILLVELLHTPQDHLVLQKFARLISCKYQVLLLQQQSLPIRNFIWNRKIICDRDLVFEIYIYLIINAITFLQFLITDNKSVCEEGL